MQHLLGFGSQARACLYSLRLLRLISVCVCVGIYAYHELSFCKPRLKATYTYLVLQYGNICKSLVTLVRPSCQTKIVTEATVVGIIAAADEEVAADLPLEDRADRLNSFWPTSIIANSTNIPHPDQKLQRYHQHHASIVSVGKDASIWMLLH